MDICHAREHLHTLAATLAFIVPDPARWLAERLDEFDAGDIEAIIAAATAPEYPPVGVKATDRDKALNYFETNIVRMRYAHYRRLGMFIGSGHVEAGWKAVGQRLKLSGMHWTQPGATGVLILRCQRASGPWDQIWTHTTTRSRPPTSPSAEPDHGYLQICRAPRGRGRVGGRWWRWTAPGRWGRPGP